MTMTWQSITKQENLDALDQAVCWDDAELLELHGGRCSVDRLSLEVNFRGCDGLDFHVLLQASSSHGVYLELAFVHCDAFNPAALRAGLRGRVSGLGHVEIGRGLDGIPCSGLLFRWLPGDAVAGLRYWCDDASNPTGVSR